MLNPTTIEIVKSTAPLIAETGPTLTAHFYERMFSRHPELKDIFNMSNQFTGAQREALFNAVYGYAANIDNLPALLPVVEKIAQKHASFNITPEMYAIVGENLLATIDELFSPGQEVLDAWAQAYAVLADVFIKREEAIYQEKETTEGGWRGTRTFKLVSKTPESSVITSFVFEPEDGKPVAAYRPGQYIGIYLAPASFENREIRQYSLSAAPNGKCYRISVKREAKGTVSNYLHDHLNVGDRIELAPPTGDFFFQSEDNTPVVLISGGVGLTPMLSMLESLSGKHNAEIHWLHAAEDAEQLAFNDHINALIHQHGNASRHVWLRNGVSEPEFFNGLMDIRQVSALTQGETRDFYLCGPVPFMQCIAKQLLDAGVDKDRIRYECFGPHKVI